MTYARMKQFLLILSHTHFAVIYIKNHVIEIHHWRKKDDNLDLSNTSHEWMYTHQKCSICRTKK